VASNIKVIMPDKQYENSAERRKALADTGGPDTVTITEFMPHPNTNPTPSPSSQPSAHSAVQIVHSNHS